MIDMFDDHERYCPVLGHYLKFGYCRKLREGLPCSKIRFCWEGRLPVTEFLDRNFNQAEIDKIFELPKNKVTALLTLIERAQGRTRQ